MTRHEFRHTVWQRDNNECLVPWCESTPADAHHIIDRGCWDKGGYIPRNGASVCDRHHRHAERTLIPPHAFWQWAGLTPVTPDGYDHDIDKWGTQLDTPSQLRDFHKYQHTPHLFPVYWHCDETTANGRTDNDDTALTSLDPLLDHPLVITVKMDGSNAQLVKDTDTPVRSRSGSDASHHSFDRLKQLYWDHDVYTTLPAHLQVFGEWLDAKHSIHYGCDGTCSDECAERNQGPALANGRFHVFGVYNNTLHTWLSWDNTVRVASRLGFDTTPVIGHHEWTNPQLMTADLTQLGRDIVTHGHEGYVVRSRYPIHWGQFNTHIGKYVREDHVQTSEHWRHTPVVTNHITQSRADALPPVSR